MRIIAGSAGGRKLKVPDGRDVRPTSDKVRGAIFNSLQSRYDLEGMRVLDMFCGSGAMGLEALSRGAAHCTFVDSSSVSLRYAKDNFQSIAPEVSQDVRFLKSDALKLKDINGQVFDFIVLDPPYHQGLVQRSLDVLPEWDMIAQNGVVLCEYEKGLKLGLGQAYQSVFFRVYGDTEIAVLEYRSRAI